MAIGNVELQIGEPGVRDMSLRCESLVFCFLLFGIGTAHAAQPQAATPLGNPGYWITTSDYPAVALREKSQGITVFRLSIDEVGRVTNCDVISSSGSVILDEAACSLVSQRARFTPARDGRGRPTKGNYSNRVRWAIPADGPVRLAPPPTIKGLLTVDADGNLVLVK